MRLSTCASLLAAVVVGSTSVVARRYESDSVLARDVDLELEAREEAIDNYVRELESKLAARGIDSEDITQVVRDLSHVMAVRDMNTIDLKARGGHSKSKHKKKKNNNQGQNGRQSKSPIRLNVNAPTINIGQPQPNAEAQAVGEPQPPPAPPATDGQQPPPQGLPEAPTARGLDERSLRRRADLLSKAKERLRQLKKSKKIADNTDSDVDNSVSGDSPTDETPKLKARGGGNGGQSRKSKKKTKKQQQQQSIQVEKKKVAMPKPGESEEEVDASLGAEEQQVETPADQKQNPSRRDMEGIILDARDFYDLNEELDARAREEWDLD